MLSEDEGPLGAGANIFTGVKKLVLSQLQGIMFKGKEKRPLPVRSNNVIGGGELPKGGNIPPSSHHLPREV